MKQVLVVQELYSSFVLKIWSGHIQFGLGHKVLFCLVKFGLVCLSSSSLLEFCLIILVWTCTNKKEEEKKRSEI